MDLRLSGIGQRAVTRCDDLGAAPFSEGDGFLLRPYLTASHRHALESVAGWMTEAGMTVRLDPIGNLIGRYEGAAPDAPALLIGSHIDTVPDGGRYDGALGVMLGIECVEALMKQDRRLPFAIEVIAFGDEEGSRFSASMLCSQAIATEIDLAYLDIADEQGATLREALEAFGLDPDKIQQAKRKPGEVLAYIEAHIEQGPVLEAEGLPIGVVTGIAAQLRLKARFIGEAGHAGTTPMRLRADALAAAADGVLAVERICKAGRGELVGTVGRIQTSTTAFNVICGEAEISIDLRAAAAEDRDTAAVAVRAALAQIAEARGLKVEIIQVQDLPSCPCDPRLIAMMGRAAQSLDIEPCFLVSGAGHDAMAVAPLAPVGMLFIRCERGVSHNAAERVDAEDVTYAARALLAFVDELEREGL